MGFEKYDGHKAQEERREKQGKEGLRNRVVRGCLQINRMTNNVARACDIVARDCEQENLDGCPQSCIMLECRYASKS